MRLPKIAIILKGRPDKNNKKLLYIRYSIDAKTSWLSLGISVAESSWDTKRRMVKNRDIDSAKLNQIINAAKFEAEQLALEFLSQNRNEIFTFELFKKQFLKEQIKEKESTDTTFPLSLLTKTVDDLLFEKTISTSSHRAYNAAINAFIKTGLANNLPEITPLIVNAFRKEIITKKNGNAASQYVRNLRVAFRHTVRRNMLNLPDPFTEKITITRLSNKKTLSVEEYQQLATAFKNSSGKDREILRRFFVLCKGLRYSDTLLLQQSDLQEFEHEGAKLWYFNRPAQKSGIAGIIAFYEGEGELLEFRKDGYLFEKITVSNYNLLLKKVSKKIINREITSHYGRHYAGDQAINSGFDIDDVKAILGISAEGTARIYAQRQNTQILTKLLKYEKNKKDTVDG